VNYGEPERDCAVVLSPGGPWATKHIEIESRQRISHLLYGVSGFCSFFVMCFELVPEQAFELVRLEVAAAHQADLRWA
jgi:hypothetical protein